MKAIGGIVTAVSTGALAAAAFAAAPHASASCASFFGIGNSADCTSTPTSFAIALGPGAKAYAQGTLGSAIAVGALSYASTDDNTMLGSATALGNGAGAYLAGGARISTAFSAGTDAAAVINGGVLNLAAGLGDHTLGYVNTPGSGPAGGSLAVAVGNSKYLAQAVADGTGNVALNVFSPASAKDFGSNVVAAGTFNMAASLLSRDSLVYAGYGAKQTSGTRNAAFSVFGRGNDIEAGGPGSIVGSIFENGAKVLRQGPGLTINGATLGKRPTQQQATVTRAAKSPRRR